MKKLSEFILVALLFTSCMAVGSRDLILEPVTVILNNCDKDRNTVLRITNVVFSELDYDKKLSEKYFKIFQNNGLYSELEDYVFIQPSEISSKKDYFFWSRIGIGEPVYLFNINKSGLQNRFILIFQDNKNLYFIDSDYFDKKYVFKLNPDKTFSKLQAQEYETVFTLEISYNNSYEIKINKK